MSKLKREHRVSVRLTESELKALDHWCKEKELSRSEYLSESLRWCQSIRFEHGHTDEVHSWGVSCDSKPCVSVTFNLTRIDVARANKLWQHEIGQSDSKTIHAQTVRIRSALRAYDRSCKQKCIRPGAKKDLVQIW